MFYGVNFLWYNNHLDGEEEGLYTHSVWRPGIYVYINTGRPLPEGIDPDSSSTPWWAVQQSQQAHDGRRGTKL